MSLSSQLGLTFGGKTFNRLHARQIAYLVVLNPGKIIFCRSAGSQLKNFLWLCQGVPDLDY